MKTAHLILAIGLTLLTACGQSEAPKSSKTDQAKDGVFFVNIKDGDSVKSPFKVEFGVRGMQVAKPGDKAGKKIGHHHLQ